MVHFRLIAAAGWLACVTQTGCIEPIQRMIQDRQPYSPRTATSYSTAMLPHNPPKHPEVQDYMARLGALQAGREKLTEGVPLRPVQVPILPPGMMSDAPPSPRSGPLGPGARRVRVYIPGARPAAPTIPEPTPAEPVAPPAPAAPAQPTKAQPAAPQLDADAVASAITALQAEAAANPNNLDLQLQLRLLLALAGRETEALQPIGGLDAERNQKVANLLRMIVTLLDNRIAATPDEASARLAALEYFQEQLRAVADLQVPVVKLCTAVDGYGVYVPFGSNTFLAGRAQQVIVYCEVRNFLPTTDETGMYRTTLNMQLALYDEAGQLAQPVQTDSNILDVSANRRHDFYLRGPYFLRSHLKPGDYTLKVTVEDPRANKVGTNSITITMVSPDS